MSVDLERRIDILENQTRDLKRIADLAKGEKGDTGRQGVPGNIIAATEATERVLDEKMASLVDRIELYAKRESDYGKERSQSLRRELDQFRKEVRESLAQHFEDEATKTRVENAVLTILHEYGVKSSFDDRIIPIA